MRCMSHAVDRGRVATITCDKSLIRKFLDNYLS